MFQLGAYAPCVACGDCRIYKRASLCSGWPACIVSMAQCLLIDNAPYLRYLGSCWRTTEGTGLKPMFLGDLDCAGQQANKSTASVLILATGFWTFSGQSPFRCAQGFSMTSMHSSSGVIAPVRQPFCDATQSCKVARLQGCMCSFTIQGMSGVSALNYQRRSYVLQ